METASADDFMALNAHLAALVAAGVPLDFGLSGQEPTAVGELNRIGATVFRRMRRGESLPQALEGDDGEVPAAYRSAVQFGLRTDNLASALPGSNQVAESVDDSRRAAETSLVYPLVICVLAFIGLIGFSLYLVPVLQSMYTSLRISPGPGFRTLRLVGTSLPYWAVVVPCVLVVAVYWWTRARRTADSQIALTGPLRWLPGTSRILFQERCSRFAASLAALLEKSVPLHEALAIAGELSGDTKLLAGAKSLAGAAKDASLPAGDSAVALQFPPFLRWCIWHAAASTGRVRALEIAARLYRESAARRAERQRTLLPLGALVFVGGTVTLLYGLTLFVPVVEFLRTLAGS